MKLSFLKYGLLFVLILCCLCLSAQPRNFQYQVQKQASFQEVDYRLIQSQFSQGNNLQEVILYLPESTDPYAPEIYLQQGNSKIFFDAGHYNEYSGDIRLISVGWDDGTMSNVYLGNKLQNPLILTPCFRSKVTPYF